MVMPLSIVRWEACLLKLILFRFCPLLLESVPAGIFLLVLSSARLRWVLRAAAGFCLLLLCSACCCLLPPAAACCCLLLPAAAGFWSLHACAPFCPLVAGSACLSVRNILPVGFSFMWFNLPILLSGSLLLQGPGSRLHLVFDLVFPGLDFLVLSPSLPFFGCSLVSLVGLLPSSCSLLWAGAAGGCLLQLVSLSLCLVVVSCLCLSSAAGCCWGTSGTSCDMQVSRRQVGHKWETSVKHCITRRPRAPRP